MAQRQGRGVLVLGPDGGDFMTPAAAAPGTSIGPFQAARCGPGMRLMSVSSRSAASRFMLSILDEIWVQPGHGAHANTR